MSNNLAKTHLIAALSIALLLIGLLLVACSGPTPDMATEPEQAQASPSPTPVSPTVQPVETLAPTPAVVLSPNPTATLAPATESPQPTPQATDAPTFTPTPPPDNSDQNGSVMPNPDYERAMRAARLSAGGWDTDFRLHTVPYSEIKFVIPRDNIPSIDAPSFITPEEASAWLRDVEPVVSLEINGDARAYPLQILIWHEIVNDVVGETSVAVTFCPLCNSAIAFDSSLDGTPLEFGVSGNLRNSDLIMYDRQTHSWWQQFTGEGIVGEHAGRSLDHLPAFIVSFADFKEVHPQGKVLSRDTGYSRQYGRNPYAGYDTTEGNPFLFQGDLDGRLLPVERVIAVTLDELDIAFPLSVLQNEGVINYALNDRSIVVFHKSGTTSALDKSSIADSRDVGAAAVFSANLDEQTLTFSVQEGKIVDDQTSSSWDILGNALDGPLAGKRLTPVVHGNHFWFAWAVFKPDTLVYQGKEDA